MARRLRRPSTASRVIAVVAITVLAVVVIGLSVLALQRGKPEATSESAAPAPTFTLGVGGASSTPTAAPTPTPTAPPASAAPGAAERFLSLGAGAWWRATAGACGVTQPLVERSTDAGSSWADVTPVYRSIGQVRALSAFATIQGEMIADMAGCETQALRTFTQGEFWESYPDVLAASTYVSPTDPATVVTPDGEIAAPCPEAWGLRASDGTAAVICEGIAYELSADAAWTPLTDASPIALAVSDGTVFVAHTDATCNGLAVSRFGDAPGLVGCAAGVSLTDPVAIAASGGDVYVWSADAVTAVAR